ncbi:MauE/DoxX family redox-associated membrane protein [Mucilaginibacter calamicampi]|uniref:MauE/DoxX family redox-associated membrane protein n=1 Tax=Mucilaginibacter calamicampi TaxID=1302352 RepID=A0ABW2YVB1_9SPHI
MKKDNLIALCIALIVLLFTYTGVGKLLDYDQFVFQMRLAPLPLMITIAPVLGIAVPAVELLIAAGLLTGRYRTRALYTTIILLSSFEIYIAGMLLTGRHLPCTCGGIISKMGWGQHLLFNLLFIGIAIAAIIMIKNFSRG